MKATHIIAVLSFFILPLSAQAGDIPAVNAALPHDHQIWPLPKPDAAMAVEAEWKSGRELLRIKKGDWFRIWNWFEYSVTSVRKGQFHETKISFIVEEKWPTPESGIVLKALPCPFVEGTKAVFYLNPSHDSKVYDIQSFEIWKDSGSPQFHRKPSEAEYRNLRSLDAQQAIGNEEYLTLKHEGTKARRHENTEKASPPLFFVPSCLRAFV